MDLREPDGLDLAAAQGLSLVRLQACGLAEAETTIERVHLLDDVISSGTEESVVRDGLCGQEMTLREFASHVRRRPGHHRDHIRVVAELRQRPRVVLPPKDDIPWPVRRRQRELTRRALLEDPEVRARLAGREGESLTSADR